MVAGLLLAFALFAAQAEAGAGKEKGGTARYEYRVVEFAYPAVGNLTSGRTQNDCVVGESADWTGRVLTTGYPAEGSGEGSLEIHRRGTSGHVEAEAPVSSSFVDAEHTLVTECNGDGMHPGQQTDTNTTQCGNVSSSVVSAFATIDGGVGNRVKIDWNFGHGAAGPYGGWMPDSFSCAGQAFEWPTAKQKCRSKSRLNQFTKGKFTLPFRCMDVSTVPPPECYICMPFYSQVLISGYVKLKRTKQNHPPG